MTDPNRNPAQARRAFTLIEVLVVIGILALLMGILLPVIGKVRTSAYDSATLHRMQALMTAIDNYHQANGAYPGPLADSELISAAGATPKAVKQTNTGSLPPLTSTENLTIALLGGAVPSLNGTTLTLNYDYSKVGVGPQSLNVITQKLYGPYADPKACGLEQPTSTGPWVSWSDGGHPTQVAFASLYKDSAIPEFTDSFPDPLPILYIRAQSGTNMNARATAGSTSPPGAVPTQANQIVWDPSQLQPYLFPAPGGPTAVSITNSDGYSTAPDAAVSADYPHPSYYFTVAADHATPLQKGGYLLIVAGKDRKFMTRDDRINGSPAQ